MSEAVRWTCTAIKGRRKKADVVDFTQCCRDIKGENMMRLGTLHLWLSLFGRSYEECVAVRVNCSSSVDDRPLQCTVNTCVSLVGICLESGPS